MVCLGNMCVDTLHKGHDDDDYDYDDDDDDDDDNDDDDDDDDDDDNNNNNKLDLKWGMTQKIAQTEWMGTKWNNNNTFRGRGFTQKKEYNYVYVTCEYV